MTTEAEMEALNSHVPSSRPGDAIMDKFQCAHQQNEHSDPLVLTRMHSGREFYVNQANSEVYDSFMGKNPEMISGRLYSEHAIKKGMEFVKSVDFDSSRETMDRYIAIRDEHQDKIDEQLSVLQIFNIPKSAEELENELKALASRAGVNLNSVKSIKQAKQNADIMKAFERVGIQPEPLHDVVENERELDHQVEVMLKRGGVSRIRAALIENTRSKI